MTPLPPPPPCRVCGRVAHISVEACPLVKAVSYDDKGQIVYVEKFDPTPAWQWTAPNTSNPAGYTPWTIYNTYNTTQSSIEDPE